MLCMYGMIKIISTDKMFYLRLIIAREKGKEREEKKRDRNTEDETPNPIPGN